MGLDTWRNQGFCVCCQIHNLFGKPTSPYVVDSKGFLSSVKLTSPGSDLPALMQ